MSPKILLIGKSGQVGRELSVLLPAIGEVTALDRTQLDLASADQIRKVIRAARPNVIVNAAAYTAVDKAESEPELARTINAAAPGVMAEEAKRLDALLVHYSTDYVFDGTKRQPYAEYDSTNPQNAYGRTKLEGERAIEESGARHLIFRTAWVYGREGKNFLLTILRLAAQREELKIVRDQTGAPTTSREIAVGTAQVLSQIHQSGRDGNGIYHMTAGGETNWFDFAESIVKQACAAGSNQLWVTAATGGKPLIVRRILPITTAEFSTPASRPAYSVLSNARLNEHFGVRLPDWQTQLHSLFAE